MSPLDFPDKERQELIDDIQTNLSRLIDYYTNYSFNRDEVVKYLFGIGGSYQLTFGPDKFDLYFKYSPEEVFEMLRALILNFLGSIKTFIENNADSIDVEVLKLFKDSGIRSHTTDIRSFTKMEDIERIKEAGGQVDFQTDRELNNSLQSITQKTINLEHLVESFNGDSANAAILMGLFIVSEPGEDLFTPAALQASYDRFRGMMERLGIDQSKEMAVVRTLTEYTLAIHLFSDALTNRDDRLGDTLSNIFFRLEYGLMVLSVYLQTGDTKRGNVTE